MVRVGAGARDTNMNGFLDNNLTLLSVNESFLHDEYFSIDGGEFVNYSLYLHHSPESWECKDAAKEKILLNKISQVKLKQYFHTNHDKF